MGVMGAVGGLNSAMDPKKFAQLQRPAQDFALTLNSLKKPIIALQNRLQAGLFPGLTAGLKAARPALSVLSGPLARTAAILGQLGDRLGHLVGSARSFLADLRSQANFNNVQIRRSSATARSTWLMGCGADRRGVPALGRMARGRWRTELSAPLTAP